MSRQSNVGACALVVALAIGALIAPLELQQCAAAMAKVLGVAESIHLLALVLTCVLTMTIAALRKMFA